LATVAKCGIKTGLIEKDPMKACISYLLILLCLLITTASGEPQSEKGGKRTELTSNQLLMRDKLTQMNRVLEGLTLNEFDQVEDSAKTLNMISRAASWHVSNPTPRYERFSKNFQEQTIDLERHAKDRNSDAAILDLVRINVTCAQCHQHMREDTARGK
jgi:hypothetical protein